MKAKKINTYYGVFLSVLTVVLGVWFIAVAVSILADGGWKQGAFSREIVGDRLLPVSIFMAVWIAAIIAGYVLSLVFPYEVKPVNKISERVTLKRLTARLPEGSGDEYECSLLNVHNERRKRLISYGVCLAVCLACVIASAVYIFNPAHFPAKNLNAEMLDMFINVFPWIFIGFAACVATAFYERYAMRREITCVKAVITQNKGNALKTPPRQNELLAKAKAVISSKYFKYAVQGTVGALAVAFIIAGVFNQGARDVLIKAINICTECIGLG